MAIERSVGQIKLKLIEAASSLAASHSELIASGNFSGYRASRGSVDALLDTVSRVEDFWVEAREKLDSIGVVDPSVEEMFEVFKEMVAQKQQAAAVSEPEKHKELVRDEPGGKTVKLSADEWNVWLRWQQLEKI